MKITDHWSRYSTMPNVTTLFTESSQAIIFAFINFFAANVAWSLPIFDYGCLIWSRGTSTNNLRLLKLQKRAAKIILNADILTPSESMFKELQWLSFSKRVLYHKSVMIFKALHGMAPEYPSEMFVKKTSQIHSRSLRSTDNDMLRVPYARTNYFENSFTVSGAKLWNTLPLALRVTSNLNTFKQNVKAHLQDN